MINKVIYFGENKMNLVLTQVTSWTVGGTSPADSLCMGGARE